MPPISSDRQAPTRRWREWPDALWPHERVALVAFVCGAGAAGGLMWTVWWSTTGQTLPVLVQRRIHATALGVLALWVVLAVVVLGLVWSLGVYTGPERAALLDGRWPTAFRDGPTPGARRWDRWRRVDVRMIRAILAAVPSSARIHEVLLVHRPRRWMRRGLVVRWSPRDADDCEAVVRVTDPAALLVTGCTPWHGDVTQSAAVWTAWVRPAALEHVHREQGATWAVLSTLASAWPRSVARPMPPAEIAWDRLDDAVAVRCGLVPEPPAPESTEVAAAEVAAPEAAPGAVSQPAPRAAVPSSSAGAARSHDAERRRTDHAREKAASVGESSRFPAGSGGSATSVRSDEPPRRGRKRRRGGGRSARGGRADRGQPRLRP